MLKESQKLNLTQFKTKKQLLEYKKKNMKKLSQTEIENNKKILIKLSKKQKYLKAQRHLNITSNISMNSKKINSLNTIILSPSKIKLRNEKYKNNNIQETINLRKILKKKLSNPRLPLNIN